MAITAATLRALRAVRVELDALIDPAVADIAAAWSRAWAEVADEYTDAMETLAAAGVNGEWPTRSMIRRADKARRVLTLTAEHVQALADHAGVRITGDLTKVVSAAAHGTVDVAATQLPRGATIDLNRVDDAAIRAIVTRTTRQITSRMLPLSSDATAAMRAALIRGVNVGDNPRTAARRMLNRTETVFNGGRWRAENIARTELIDAGRVAAQAAMAKNSDVIAGWVWQAELSHRTCPACLSMHGTEWAASEPGPLGHPSCRCARLPQTVSWRDLDLDLPEPESKLPDAKRWYDSQPAETQRQIMGDARYEALKDGQLSWDGIAERRANPDWRPSYVPAAVPPAGTSRRAA